MSACLVAAVVLIGAALALRLTAQDPDAVASSDSEVGFHVWDSCGRETSPESWPAWLIGWSCDGGTVLTNPAAWYVHAETRKDCGSLYLILDRQHLGTNAGMEVQLDLYDSPQSSLYLDLLSTNMQDVAPDLFGNVLQGTGERQQLLMTLPLATNPAASVIRLRRGAGEIAVYDCLLLTNQAFDISALPTKSPPIATVSVSQGTGTRDFSEQLVQEGEPERLSVAGCPELRTGGAPLPETRSERGTIYVSANLGDDANDGMSGTRVHGRNGPKRTIRGALAAANRGASIVIMDGEYSGNVNFCGLDVKVTTTGNIRIR